MKAAKERGYDDVENKMRGRFLHGQPLIRQVVLEADRGMVF